MIFFSQFYYSSSERKKKKNLRPDWQRIIKESLYRGTYTAIALSLCLNRVLVTIVMLKAEIQIWLTEINDTKSFL